MKLYGLKDLSKLVRITPGSIGRHFKKGGSWQDMPRKVTQRKMVVSGLEKNVFTYEFDSDEVIKYLEKKFGT